MSSTSIFSLPNEIILIIMDNLSIYDKMAFSMTCRNFHTLFNLMPELNRDKLVRIVIDRYESFFSLFTETDLPHLPRSILPHLQFDGCRNITCNKKFWEKYGKFVLSISFEYCTYNGDDFLQQIIAYCPALKNLNATFFFHLWTSAINKISELQLANLESVDFAIGLSDYSLNNFINNAPKLKHIGTLKDIPENSIPIPEGSDWKKQYLTIKNVLNVLQSSKINSIRIENTIEIKHLCGLKNVVFKLEAISGFQDDCPFKLLGNTFEDSLKHLEFSYFANYFDVDLAGLNKLINLKTLILPNFKVSALDGLEKLQSLKNLEEFQLIASYEYSPSPVNPNYVPVYVFDALKNLHKLRRLTMEKCSLPDIHCVISNTNVKLTELCLIGCKIKKINELFISILNQQKLLQKLHIEIISTEIINICSGELHDGIGSLKYLKYLTLVGLNINEESLIQEFKLKELTKLDLNNTKKVSDAALLNFSTNCPALTELNLENTSISDKGLKYLSNLSRLRTINIKGTRITVDGIKYLLKSPCPVNYCVLHHDIRYQINSLAEKYNRKIIISNWS